MLTIKDIAVRYSVNNATAAKYIGLSFTWKSKYTRKEKRKTMIDPSGLEKLDKLVQARRKRAWTHGFRGMRRNNDLFPHNTC